MDACRRVHDTGIVLHERPGILAALLAAARHDEARHADTYCALDNRTSIVIETVMRQVRADVYQVNCHVCRFARLTGLVSLLDHWGQDANDIEDILKADTVVKSAPQRTRDIVAGYGEIWSARLLAAHLQLKLGAGRAGTWIDARDVVKVRYSELGPAVLWESCWGESCSICLASQPHWLYFAWVHCLPFRLPYRPAFNR